MNPRWVSVLAFGIAVQRTWIPTDGESTLTPFWRFRSSSTEEQSQAHLIQDLTPHPEDVTFFPPEIGTISRGGANTFLYTAPHGIDHASLPVTIRLRVRNVPASSIILNPEITRTLHVVRRKWTVKAEFKINTNPCVGEQSFAYSYSDVQNLDFLLGDLLDLHAVSTLGRLPPEPVLTSCKCTATLLGRPGNMTFTGADGYLLVGSPTTFYLFGSAEVPNLFPGASVKCGDGVGAVGPISAPFFLTLLGSVPGGLHPSDARPRFILVQGIVTIIVEWYSVAE